ncbi:tetraacyldisaccharide 4'-kinase [Lacihabitans soyangensis]|uniref:Tetraacyldisaccharide 4'-kinase n=1 Tax=Lacihabitans soyangensis TaxID=869394 RepID=A0AAE3KXB0_9BACT|nr:tetraacyldisaccharide 4'-kinase [Lacihabitans soyangensis]MCP9764500.1 tetraacyldisaccharide 4'-kinase [Lacihabitans soyangensis]
MLQFLKYLLFPFSLLYKGITSLRNLLFDIKILPSFEPPLPTIGVGNLTVGGTGKTPIIDYLISILSKQKIGVISRGYGRKTKGYISIDTNTSPEKVGDEPFMLSRMNPEANFFVCENRVVGYSKAVNAVKDLEIVLFDDVFQHRYIKPKLNLLLCDYNRPFYDDYVLPTGMLRESRYGAKRADIVIVTKCPEAISGTQKNEIRGKIAPYCSKNIPIYFASFKSQIPNNSENTLLDPHSKVVLISGLANNSGFRKGLEKDFNILKHFEFKDHHNFKKSELQLIISEFTDYNFVCSEKDFVKIKPLLSSLELPKFFVSRQKVELFEEESFKKLILAVL